jgi:hypothetical protein
MTVWAELRQVIVATTDPVGVAGLLREQLWLGAGFGDPELDAHGIADDTMAVGAHTYLEVVSPTTPDHPMAQWLEARGGTSGYLLSVQVSDVDACLERCRELGVRVPLTQPVQGFRIAQLHRGDMGFGLEIDGIVPRGRWFWDILDVDRPADARVDDIVAVDVAVKDPVASAARMAAVLGLPGAAGSIDSIDLGGRTVRFVESTDRNGTVAVSLHAVDRAEAGNRFDVAGIDIVLV